VVGEVIGIIGQIPRYYRVFTTSQFNHAKPGSQIQRPNSLFLTGGQSTMA
jgi:hypothetical protein